MTPETPHMMVSLTSLTNGTETDFFIRPIITAYVAKIIGFVNAYVLSILVGIVGVFTNTANVSVYLKMGLSETTNVSFFTLSIFDLLVSLSTVVNQITYSRPVSLMRLPSGAPVSEVGMGALYILYPCLGCSAWITAVLSIERCLCISLPLKVKEIVTPMRTMILILTIMVYQAVFIVLLYVYPGPPYDAVNLRRTLYFNCSFSAPSFICFFLVAVSTTLLVIRLKQNLEWRNEAGKQSYKSSGSQKERKAARCVVAICIVFIVCFTPNVALFVAHLMYPQFSSFDPYLGSLKRVLYAFSSLLQVLSSAVNIVIYYRMGTKYREVFNALFIRQRGKES